MQILDNFINLLFGMQFLNLFVDVNSSLFSL